MALLPVEVAVVIHYSVRKDNRPVLVFDDAPGVLLSTAVRPPGHQAPHHPFVNAQALDARHEQRLAELLGQARSVPEFIALLEQGGFVVESEAGSQPSSGGREGDT